jgi:hypothetical protein
MLDIVVLEKRVALLGLEVTSGNGSHQRSQLVCQSSSVFSSARQRLERHNHNKNQSIGVHDVKKSSRIRFKKQLLTTLLGRRNLLRSNFVMHEILRSVRSHHNRTTQRFRVQVG